MRRILIALTFALSVPVMAASAQGVARHNARQAVRQHVRHDVRNVRVAKRELREDLRQRNRAAMMGNRRRVWQETREIRHDRRVIQRQTHDLQRTLGRRRFGR